MKKMQILLGIIGVCIVAVLAIFSFSYAPSGYIACTEELRQAEVCTMEYDPVCGDNWVTYSNPCVACSSGAIESYRPGECSIPENAHICTEEEKQAEVCTMEYDPVCGSNGVTYSNGCQACAAGVDYHVPGEC